MKYNYDEKNKNSVISSQCEMLRRIYPEYDGSQYCLWLVPDYIERYNHAFVTCDVKVVLKSGEELSLPDKKIIRNPYPNKRIFQHGVKCGRRCIYGIPLLFESYDDLCNVSEVHITWAICRYMTIAKEKELYQKPFSCQLITLLSKHLNIVFDEKKDCKCYTLNIYNSLYDEGKDSTLTNQDYDFMGCGTGFLEFIDSEVISGIEKDTFEMSNIIDVYIHGVPEERELSDEEDKIFDFIDSLSLENYYDRIFTEAFPMTVVGKDNIDYAKYYYEKSNTVVEAADYFDILPESSFGFKSLSEFRNRTGTLLDWLLYRGYDVYDDFLKIVDDIEYGYEELELEKKYPNVFDEEETEFLKNDIEDWEKRIKEIKTDFLKNNKKANWEKEVENVNQWWKEKERKKND